MDSKTKDNIYEIQRSKNLSNDLIADLFCDFYDYSERENIIKGGCHFLSLLFHIILSEFGIENKLCLGNVKLNGEIFSHSWVSIKCEVYDIAISNTNQEKCNLDGFVFSNINTGDMTKTKVKYGGLPNEKLADRTGLLVANMNFEEYIKGCPYRKDYVLNLVVNFAKDHKKYLNSGRLMNKYKDEKWTRM